MTIFVIEYQDAFSLFDKKGDGMIGCDQVGEVLRALGLNPLAAEIKKLIKELDPDGKFMMYWCYAMGVRSGQNATHPLN